MGMMFALRADGFFRDSTGDNTFAGGAPFYDTYETLDRKYEIPRDRRRRPPSFRFLLSITAIE
jgi:hypothetical protein